MQSKSKKNIHLVYGSEIMESMVYWNYWLAKKYTTQPTYVTSEAWKR